jgi:transmembrane sensor
MDHAADLNRLVRYVIGECSADDVADIERWIAADPSRGKLVDELRTIWATADVTPSGWDPASAWAKVSRQLDPAPHRAFAARTVWRIAAAILLVAGISLLYRAGALSRTSMTERHASGSVVAAREYVTRPGQRAEFRLGDGTRVILGVASRLKVPAEYGVARRDVQLDGQAYFEVNHDGIHPFTVYTARGIVEDLGTRFDVLTYRGDTVVQVVVVEGKVALGRDMQLRTMLVAGQLGQLRPNGTVTVQRDVDLARQLAWTHGRLVFANTALRDALPQLSRWYDLEFRLADSATAALPLTATFPAHSTPEMLDLLALTLGVRQERRGRVVTLYAR